MRDPRINKLADMLVNYSVHCERGEKVFIDAKEVDNELIKALIEQVFAAGGYPYVECIPDDVRRALYMGTSKEHMDMLADFSSYVMNQMDCYIGIRGGNNCFELSDVPAENMKLYNSNFFYPVHHEIRVAKTKWVVLRYPTAAMAQLSAMSTEAFEDYYFDVCTLDYSKMDRAMDALKALMDRTDKVRLVAKDTDLTFSIRGLPAIKCAGRINIPDGEIYTAPVKNSVNGVITYNTPSLYNGIKHEHISLTFENGRIVKIDSSCRAETEKIFNTDEGARYVGEFAIGVNPYVTQPMLDTLFDEKIAGSIHFTPGCCYDNAYNGNQSAIHWDLVLIMTPEYGGGEIWFDDVLIRKDGRFVLPELTCLNPEHLK